MTLRAGGCGSTTADGVPSEGFGWQLGARCTKVAARWPQDRGGRREDCSRAVGRVGRMRMMGARAHSHLGVCTWSAPAWRALQEVPTGMLPHIYIHTQPPARLCAMQPAGRVKRPAASMLLLDDTSTWRHETKQQDRRVYDTCWALAAPLLAPRGVQTTSAAAEPWILTIAVIRQQRAGLC